MSIFGPNVEKLKAKRDIEGLIKVLSTEKKFSLRQAAAVALGQLGDRRVVEPLIIALADEDVDVHYASRDALKMIDPNWVKSDAAKKSLPKLLSALQSDDSGVRVRVLGEMVPMGDPSTVEPIIAALTDKYGPVRAYAAAALGEIKDRRAVEPLIQVIDRKESKAREQVVTALGKIGDIRAVAPILQALKDDIQEHQAAHAALNNKNDVQRVLLGGAIKPVETSHVATALEEIANANIADSTENVAYSESIELLIETLKSRDTDLRKVAAEALGYFKSQRAMEPLLQMLNSLNDADKGPKDFARSMEIMHERNAVTKSLEKLGWQSGK